LKLKVIQDHRCWHY